MRDFLTRCGWSEPAPLALDASARRYYRVRKGNKTAVFMDASGGDPQEIAGFIRIADWLRSVDLSAPEILEQDMAQGFLLLEDFGQTPLRAALQAMPGDDEGMREIYALATGVLDHLQKQTCPPDLPDYYKSNVHKGRRRIVDWFVPAVRGVRNPDGLVEQYQALWEAIEKALPEPRLGFVHVDYHMENLMLLPERSGARRCGILDFQGAMYGPVQYDLANLLYDARADMSSALRAEILEHLTPEDQCWTQVLAAQFHCRVIGQFIKFAVQKDDRKYLCHLPRLQNYMQESMKNPLLKPLSAFFNDLKLDFSCTYGLNVPEISRYIREDAF
ncbi:MAG: phosphotransferase [Alphaproteobacteria bacterium]|nr:phosphotransferase [Alphaproteobacteria bacterium]